MKTSRYTTSLENAENWAPTQRCLELGMLPEQVPAGCLPVSCVHLCSPLWVQCRLLPSPHPSQLPEQSLPSVCLNASGNRGLTTSLRQLT